MANVGSAAPDFTLTGAVNQDDVEVSLGDYAGKNLVVLFYPLAFSPVCAEQVQISTKNWGQFSRKMLMSSLSIGIQLSHIRRGVKNSVALIFHCLPI